jgi:TrmH family RNA methyltransferase
MSLSRAQRHRLRQIARGRGEEGLFLLDGPKSIRDAVSRGQVVELYLRDEDVTDAVQALRDVASAQDIVIMGASKADLDKVAGTVTPQGALALVADAARDPAEVLALDGPLFWLDGVQDPGNLGAILRVAAAFDVAGVILGQGCAHPMGRKALRASAGLALTVPFCHVAHADLATTVRGLARPLWVLAGGGESLFEAEPIDPRVVFVLGAEGRGVRRELRKAAQRTIGIPMSGGVESLNVAVSAGIVAAWARQLLAETKDA